MKGCVWRHPSRWGGLLLWLLRQHGESASRVTEEEVHVLLAEAHEGGVLETEEREMITGVMRFSDRSAKALTRRNSMTSPYLWLLCMCAAIPSVLFWDNTAVLAVLIVAFGVCYVALYWRIVRFKSPRWMVFRR